MPRWYFSKERLVNRTPSRTSGVDLATETRYRREGCRFIMDMGNKLGLRYDTMATGVIYFHRFYMKQSFKTFPRWVTACACLFLAGKVEETPKKCRDIIKVAKSMLSDHHFQLFGENPREEVMMYERVLLQTIKFDLQVDHPYAVLLKIGKVLKGDKTKVQKLVQMAWTFVNDSLSTNLCLRRKPEVLAIAHLTLAGKLANFDLKSSMESSNRPWWSVFNKDMKEVVIEEICDEMLELYGGKKKEKPNKTKEKLNIPKNEPSPNTSSSTSSPSITNSPPFKKKRFSSNKYAETEKSAFASFITNSSVAGRTCPSDAVKSKPVASVSISQPLSTCGSVSSSEPPVVENVSPAVTDNLLKTSSISVSSNPQSNEVQPTPAGGVMPPQVSSGSFIAPAVPSHSSFLTGTYAAGSYGIPHGQVAESAVSTSTNSSFLPPAPPAESLYVVPTNVITATQNPGSFGQTYSTIPPLPFPPHQPPPQLHQPSSQPHLSHAQSHPALQTHQPGQPHHPPPQHHPLYPSHQASPQPNLPPMPLLPPVMNNQMPPTIPGGNNPNWHSLYNRPPSNNQPMGSGGWLR